MLVFAMLAVFIAGLMVGRTPEYLGKKIEPREIKLVALYIAGHAPRSCWSSPRSPSACRSPARHAAQPGPHGLTEMLYAFTSAANNNGSRLRGPHRRHALLQHSRSALAMLLGRFLLIVAVLALAGSLAAQEATPGHGRHLPDRTPRSSSACSSASSLIVGGLTFFPALALGPHRRRHSDA